ncbi:hypothetical protein D3C71_1007910 [compost metagenome]
MEGEALVRSRADRPVGVRNVHRRTTANANVKLAAAQKAEVVANKVKRSTALPRDSAVRMPARPQPQGRGSTCLSTRRLPRRTCRPQDVRAARSFRSYRLSCGDAESARDGISLRIVLPEAPLSLFVRGSASRRSCGRASSIGEIASIDDRCSKNGHCEETRMTRTRPLCAER